MTSVIVFPNAPEPTHDLKLSDGIEEYGLQFSDGPEVLQQIPASPPPAEFTESQRSWFGGLGRLKYTDDPNSFFDQRDIWSMTDKYFFPMPRWKIAQGLKNCNLYMPGSFYGGEDVVWKSLFTNGTARFVSGPFTPGANYNADKCYLWIRKCGNPDDLTFKLVTDSSGPGSVLQTVTLSAASITDILSIFQVFDWTGVQAVNSATLYHVYIYGSASDNDVNHWEVAIDPAGSGSYTSTDGTTWNPASFRMYLYVVDNTSFTVSIPYYRWYTFYLAGALYAAKTSLVFINGDRGSATAGGNNTLTDSSKAWGTQKFVGAKVRLIDGSGQQGQERTIVSHTDTQLTVDANWDSNPSPGSAYVIYATPWWTPISTGGVSLVPIPGPVGVINQIAYFPGGPARAAVRMRVNGSSHDFAADGTNQFWRIIPYSNPNTNMIQALAVNTTLSNIIISDAKPWGTNLNFGSVTYPVGTSDTNINSIHIHDGVPYVLKEDGIYSFQNFRPKKLGQGFGDVPDHNNGLAVASFNESIYWSWAHSINEMTGSQSRDILNYKSGYNGIHADRTGNVIAIQPGIGWLFFAIDGGAANYSSVYAWNQYGMHEIFRGWAKGVRITNISWQPNEGSNPKLWIFLGDEIIYIDFPKYAANPLLDTGMTYMHEGALITSTFEASDPLLHKFVHEVRVLSEYLSSACTIHLDYQINQDVGTSNWDRRIQKPLVQSPFDTAILDQGEVFAIRFRIRLETSDASIPPICNGLDVLGAKISPVKYKWIATFKTGTDQLDLQNNLDHNPDRLIEWLVNNAKKAFRLRMRSLNQAMDDKVVIVSAPAITRQSVDESGWQGHFSLLIQEA